MSVQFLCRIVRLAHCKKALVGLGVGRTLELPRTMLRFHRYQDYLEVTDMRNAGKRGKSAPRFNLTWGHNLEDAFVTGVIDPILGAGSYGEALSTAEDLTQNIAGAKWPSAKDPGNWGQETYPTLTLRTETVNAFYLAPLGSKIELDAPKFELSATPQDFTIIMKIKTQHENRYLGRPSSKTHAKKTYLWLRQDGVLPSLVNLDFRGVLNAIHGATGMWPEYH